MHFEEKKLTLLKRIESFLSERHVESYLVGGFVRDLLLGRETADFDLAVQGDGLIIAQEIANVFNGKCVVLDSEHGVARVAFFPKIESAIDKQCYIDLSTITGSINNDLARRDFTINAMAIPLKSPVDANSLMEVIDPFRGRDDLDKKQIRLVSQSAFKDDPLRLLRAIRLEAELGLKVEPETELLMRQSAVLIAQVPGERIHGELIRIFSVHNSGKYVRYMDDLGLIMPLLPELERGREVEQPSEHHWKVLDHSIESVSSAGFLIKQGNWSYCDPACLSDLPWSDDLDGYFKSEVVYGTTRGALLKLAALLHDIAKPETKILTDERIRFFGHDKRGADQVYLILERLRFSHKEIDLVEKMVRYHMRPTQIGHNAEVPSGRAAFRFFRDTGSAAIGVLFLSLADHLAARGPDLDLEQWRWHVSQVVFLLNDYFKKDVTVSPPKLIDGHDLSRIFNLAPGPEMGKLLSAVKEAQAAGEISTRDEALSYVKNQLLYRKQN